MNTPGMPKVVTLKSWAELNTVPVLDSRTGLPINPPRFDSKCMYTAAGICNKCGRVHDGQYPLDMVN